MPRNGYYKITRKGDRLLRLHEEEKEDAWEDFNTSLINQLIKSIERSRGIDRPIDTHIDPDSEPGENLAWFAEVTGRLGLLQHIKEDDLFWDQQVREDQRHILEELLDKGYIRFIANKDFPN